LHAKAQNCYEAAIPDWYFTKLAKDNDKFDLFRSEFMPQYYGIKKIVWKQVNFNYAILKTKKPLIENSQLTDNIKIRFFYNDCNTFFDDPCLVFESEELLTMPDDTEYAIQFCFYQKGKQEHNSIIKKADDYFRFGNHYYYVIKVKDIDLQNIEEIKDIDIKVNSAKVIHLHQ